MTKALWVGRYRSVFAVAVSAIFAAPLYLALVNVFKPADAIRAHPLAVPLHDFTTSNVVSAAQLSLVQHGLKTSLIITVGSLTASRAACSGMENITTTPPSSRYFANVSAVRRSPVFVHCTSL